MGRLMVALGGVLAVFGVFTVWLHVQHWQPCLASADTCLDIVMYGTIPLYHYVWMPMAVIALGFIFAVWTRRPWVYFIIAVALLWSFGGAISDPGFDPQYADPGPGAGIFAGVGYIVVGVGFAFMSRIPRAVRNRVGVPALTS